MVKCPALLYAKQPPPYGKGQKAGHPCHKAHYGDIKDANLVL